MFFQIAIARWSRDSSWPPYHWCLACTLQFHDFKLRWPPLFVSFSSLHFIGVTMACRGLPRVQSTASWWFQTVFILGFVLRWQVNSELSWIILKLACNFRVDGFKEQAARIFKLATRWMAAGISMLILLCETQCTYTFISSVNAFVREVI